MAKKGIFFIVIFFIIFLTTSILTYDPNDFFASSGQGPQEYKNWFGFLGAFVSNPLFILFGIASYLFIPLFILVYISYKKRYIQKRRRRYLQTYLLFIITISYIIVFITGNQGYSGGGLTAGIVNSLINRTTGILGEVVALLFLMVTMVKVFFQKGYIEQYQFIKDLYNKKTSDPPVEETVDKQEVQEENKFTEKNKSTKKNKVKNKKKKPPLFEKVTYGYFPDEDPEEESGISEIPYLSKQDEIEEDQEDIIVNESSDKEIKDDLWTHKVQENNFIDRPFEENYLSRTNSESIESFRNIDNTVDVAKWKHGLEELPIKKLKQEERTENKAKIDDFESIDNIDESDDIEIEEIIDDYDYQVEDSYAERFESGYIEKENTEKQVEEDSIEDKTIEEIESDDFTEDKEVINDDILIETTNDNIPFEKKEENIKQTKRTEELNKIHHESFASLAVSHLNTEIINQDEKDTSVLLEETLAQFGIEAKVTHISRGPVITRYEVLPAPGIRVSKIVGLQDNIALNLAASKIRIVAPIPGKSAVGIEIPNKHRDAVTLGDLLNSEEFQNQEAHLPIALGKGISGKTVIADLVTMPHLLIAGATGSGKSVFVNTLISSLLYSTNPDYLRFIMIDPKRVELKSYDEIPYLLAPVITEPKKAVVALKWAVNEMEERYKILEKYGSRDIRSYNKKIKKLKETGYATDSYFEYIVIIVDEFADLMMVCGKEAEEQVSRLAAMSRAVGIHLVLATQRPSVDVITGLIKANFPARIAFQVSSKTESRIILDANGADKLLGKGDMLFSAPGYGGSLRIQSAFLSDDEVYELSSRLKSIGPPDYIEELENIEIEGETVTDFTVNDEPLFREAVEVVLTEKKASASYLQRKLRIGYNRAARIIELMESEGIISSQNGSKARDVLIENYEVS